MSWATLLVTVLPVLLAWKLYSLTRKRLAYDLHKIPSPPGWPLLGNIGQLYGTNHMHRVFAQWANQLGPIYKCSLGVGDILVITDPDETSKLSSRELDIPKDYLAYKGLNPRYPHDSFFVTQDYEEWKHVRKTISAAFSPESIRSIYPKIYNIACQAAGALEQLSSAGKCVDVNSIMSRAAAEVISDAGFEEPKGNLAVATAEDGSKRPAHVPALQYMKTIQNSLAMELTDPLYKLGLKLMPLHPKARAFTAAQAAINKSDDETAAKIRQAGPQPLSNVSIRACLSRLVNPKTGDPMHITKLAANANFMFLAGYETTAHALTWTLFELAAHQSLQGRVRQELREAGLADGISNKPARPLEYADLTKLPLLEAVLRETLRLHSTAPMGSIRKSKEDMTVMGYRIPKGMSLVLAPYPLHLSAANYIHPAKFWPERWLPESSADDTVLDPEHPDATPKGNRRNLAASFTTFSTGPRNCVGQSLALTEARTILAVLLARFQFELPEGVSRERFIETEEVTWVTLQTRHGLLLKLTPLQHQMPEE